MSDQGDQGDQGDAAELARTHAEPQPTVTGRFAMYARENGGVTVFYDVGAGMVRQDVPAALVRLMSGNGPMVRRLRGMLGKGEE